MFVYMSVCMYIGMYTYESVCMKVKYMDGRVKTDSYTASYTTSSLASFKLRLSSRFSSYTTSSAILQTQTLPQFKVLQNVLHPILFSNLLAQTFQQFKVIQHILFGILHTQTLRHFKILHYILYTHTSSLVSFTSRHSGSSRSFTVSYTTSSLASLTFSLVLRVAIGP